MKLKAFLAIASILAVGLLRGFEAGAENIDPNEDGSQYAWGENVGWMNFEPNVPGDSNSYGVTVSGVGLSGYVWAENIGWINLDPDDGDPETGVINDGTGLLSGFAWGENIGWINFEPNVPADSNRYGVIIDEQGGFSGWGWAENIGWINFGLDEYGIRACKVNYEDLTNFVDDWLESGSGFDADLDGSENVDFADYGILADCWRDYCPDDWPLKNRLP